MSGSDPQRAAFVSAYSEMLRQLKAPDKVAINTLSMLAGDNKQYLVEIVTAILQHIMKCPQPHKLPGLYLVDSIMKNVREPYVGMFAATLPEVFGAVWTSSLQTQRASLQKLCGTWKGVLPDEAVAKCNARMQAERARAAQQQQQQSHVPAQQAPLQAMPYPPQPQYLQQQQQQQPQQQLVLQPLPMQSNAGVPLGSAVMAPYQQQQQQQVVTYMQINGQLVPVVQQQQPALVTQLPPLHPQQAATVTPQHVMQATGLPSPAHPGWPLPPAVTQQWAGGPLGGASPAARASPMHTSSGGGGGSQLGRSTSPHGGREASAALGSLLDSLVAVSGAAARAADDAAVKDVTAFSPAFLKAYHAGVVQQLEAASERTRPRFRDVEFQRNKRRAAAAAAGSSRGWYLAVDVWVAGTTAGMAAGAAADDEDGGSGDEGAAGEAPPAVEPEDMGQTECAISGEPFDKFFDPDADGWFYRGVTRLTGDAAARHGVPDGSLVKVGCLSEAAAAAGGGAELAAADMATAAAAAAIDPPQQQQQHVAVKHEPGAGEPLIKAEAGEGGGGGAHTLLPAALSGAKREAAADAAAEHAAAALSGLPGVGASPSKRQRVGDAP